MAKLATDLEPIVKNIPYTDLRTIMRNKAKLSTIKNIEHLGKTKGIFYFQNYHNKNAKPWFYNKNISRELAVTINRCRSGHNNLKESLFKINVIQDPLCQCGASVENLNHIVWQCHLFDQQRINLIQELSKCKQYLPLDITTFLVKPNIYIMRLINKFLQNCNIRI